MPSLHDLLDEAAGVPRPFDTGADLHRGHRAVARRRRRWAAGVAGCMVSAGAVTLAALPHRSDRVDTLRSADGGPSGPVSSSPGSDEVRLEYYDVPPPPTGWHIVGERPQYVMITRDGSGVTTIDSGFVGQIVVMLSPGVKAYDVILDQQSLEFDGRTFYTNGQDGGPGMTTVSVRTADGNWLQIQYPGADFSVHEMVAYLDGVIVKDGARPGDPSSGRADFHVVHKHGDLFYLRGKSEHPGNDAAGHRKHHR
jgi:hypothetical protein